MRNDSAASLIGVSVSKTKNYFFDAASEKLQQESYWSFLQLWGARG